MVKTITNLFNMQSKAEFGRDVNKKPQLPKTERYIKTVSNQIASPFALVILGVWIFVAKGSDLLIPSLQRPRPKEKGPGSGFKPQGEKKTQSKKHD